MERELKQTKAELDAKNSEIKTMRSTMERYNQDMSKLEQQLKEQRVCTYFIFVSVNSCQQQIHNFLIWDNLYKNMIFFIACMLVIIFLVACSDMIIINLSMAVFKNYFMLSWLSSWNLHWQIGIKFIFAYYKTQRFLRSSSFLVILKNN